MTDEDQASLDSAPLEYPVHVLFLCNGNSARSQIAEALLIKRGRDRFIVASAGANPAEEVGPEAITALRQNWYRLERASPGRHQRDQERTMGSRDHAL